MVSCDEDKVVEGIHSSLIHHDMDNLKDDQVVAAADALSHGLTALATNLRNTLASINVTENKIRNTRAILPDLLQSLRQLKHIRDWRQRKQAWHKDLLRWREAILASQSSLSLTEFEHALLCHKQAAIRHYRDIHLNELPLISAADLAVIAACDPLLELWRSTLPTRRPNLLIISLPVQDLELMNRGCPDSKTSVRDRSDFDDEMAATHDDSLTT